MPSLEGKTESLFLGVHEFDVITILVLLSYPCCKAEHKLCLFLGCFCFGNSLIH